jgi:ABC-type protease/lipase transport system fused ATPase/permease subunit
MVSHRPTLVQHLDRVALLRDGELQIVVTAEEFMKRSGRPLSLRMVKDEA